MRTLSPEEKSLLTTLLSATSGGKLIIPLLDSVDVRPYDDGGMGSLELFPRGSRDYPGRRFGQQLVSGEFTDNDGTDVSVTVNLDDHGALFELDVWKVDNSPLKHWPEPNDVRNIKATVANN